MCEVDWKERRSLGGSSLPASNINSVAAATHVVGGSICNSRDRDRGFGQAPSLKVDNNGQYTGRQ